MGMGRNVVLQSTLLSCLLIASVASDWNILKQNHKSSSYSIWNHPHPRRRHHRNQNRSEKLEERSLKSYCESWRINVELNNIRAFAAVPEECADLIGEYMSSAQYLADSERAVEECGLFLRRCGCSDGEDPSRNAWIFDVDDTLLSTVPFYQYHNFRGDMVKNMSILEGWMSKSKAPALKHTLKLFNEIKGRGIKIFLISARGESLRSATVSNLINEGYQGWASLALRGDEDESKSVQEYKAGVRKRLVSEGYRIHAVVGAQWSSLKGDPRPRRTFKLPNSLYYVA